MIPLAAVAMAGAALGVFIARRRRDLPTSALTAFARTTAALEVAVRGEAGSRIAEAMDSSLQARADAEAAVGTARHPAAALRHWRAIDRRHRVAMNVAGTIVSGPAGETTERGTT